VLRTNLLLFVYNSLGLNIRFCNKKIFFCKNKKIFLPLQFKTVQFFLITLNKLSSNCNDMKKNIFNLLAICLFFIGGTKNVKAQYIRLKDVNLANQLRASFPSCFNAAGQVDTTCAVLNNSTALQFQNVSDISELINICKSLEFLELFTCHNLNNLPKLPPTLKTLKIRNTSLLNSFKIAPLPTDLRYLTIMNTSIDTLPDLSNTKIKQLTCTDNYGLTSLPKVPLTLDTILCQENKISDISTLKNSAVKFLYCHKNHITDLSNLPNTLTDLGASENHFSVIDKLPNSIKEMDISNNLYLYQIVNLPANLKTLYAQNSSLVYLDNLPQNVEDLYFSGTRLMDFPELESKTKLYKLDIGSTYVRCLPKLPSGLSILNLNGSPVNCLPNWPSGIQVYQNSQIIPFSSSMICNSPCVLSNETITQQESIYPNPTQGLVNLTFKAPTQEMQLEVVNAVGQSIKNIPVPDSISSFSLDFSDQLPGTYLIVFRTKGEITSRNFIVLN
jgi:hypothetical protein